MAATATAPAKPALDAIPMTDEQKFLFDLKGWLLLPAVIGEDRLPALREHCRLLREDPQSLPAHERFSLAGPANELLDHPAIVGILRAILQAPDVGAAYGFRCDGSYPQYRKPGDAGIEPHGGGPNVMPLFSYQCKNQSIYSGLTRVVWELNAVEHGQGGTLLMSGSHKANFSVPPEHLVKESWAFETYSCPPGSVLFFTENLCHSGATWRAQHPRAAIFNCYAHAGTQYHKLNLPPEAVERMPAKRRTLFRGTWQADFTTAEPKLNDTFSRENRAW
jgi:ectoine hydroxylase-related dioxygenase (phytanoyl-CoA dioxygenase family)